MGQGLAAALAEQRVLLAVVAAEAAHVLDHADDADVALAGHRRGPDGDLLRAHRRSGHDDHLGARQHAGQAHLHVAGARWHVDQQVVEIAPVDVLEEVLDGAVEHEPAPHQRVALVVDQQAHRHDLEATAPHRLDLRGDLALAGRGALEASLEAEHAGDREAPDVGVEHADREALRGQRGGQVDGDARLAHAALARRDGQHPGGRRAPRWSGAFSRTFQRALAMAADFSSLVSSVQRRSTSVTPGSDPTRALTSRLELGSQGAPGGGEGDRDRRPRPRARSRPPWPCPARRCRCPARDRRRRAAAPSPRRRWAGRASQPEAGAVSGTARILPGSAV